MVAVAAVMVGVGAAVAVMAVQWRWGIGRSYSNSSSILVLLCITSGTTLVTHSRILQTPLFFTVSIHFVFLPTSVSLIRLPSV